jgi:hypothetical protein
MYLYNQYVITFFIYEEGGFDFANNETIFNKKSL